MENKNNPVIAKVDKRYILSFADMTLYYTIDVQKAYVFENKQDFVDKMNQMNHPELTINPNRFILDAKRYKGVLYKNFVLKQSIGNNVGYYFEKIELHKIYLTKNIENAKGFETEKAATTYRETKLHGTTSYEIVPVNQEN